MSESAAQLLVSLADADLRKRAVLAATGALFNGYHPDMESLHIANAHELARIIDRLGAWPHENLVGRNGAEAAWLVVQHAISLPDFQRRALHMMQACADHVPPAHIAFLEDRIRCNEGRRQIYGTQFDWDDNGQLSPRPIEDEDGVDARRVRIGLEPLAEKTQALRRAAAAEGETAPRDPAARRREQDAWAQKSGWRS